MTGVGRVEDIQENNIQVDSEEDSQTTIVRDESVSGCTWEIPEDLPPRPYYWRVKPALRGAVSNVDLQHPEEPIYSTTKERERESTTHPP